MTDPAYLGGSHGTGGTNVSQPDPGFAGAGLLVVVSGDTGPTPPITGVAPDGTWTLLYQGNLTNDGCQYWCWWKSSATGSGTYTFTIPGVSDLSMGIAAFSGVDPTTPINVLPLVAQDTANSIASPVSITAPTVTTTAKCLLVWVAVADPNGSTPDTNTTVPPSGFTTRIAHSGGWNMFSIADMVQSGAGATGAQTGTIARTSVTFGATGFLIALNPVGGGGGGGGASASSAILSTQRRALGFPPKAPLPGITLLGRGLLAAPYVAPYVPPVVQVDAFMAQPGPMRFNFGLGLAYAGPQRTLVGSGLLAPSQIIPITTSVFSSTPQAATSFTAITIVSSGFGFSPQVAASFIGAELAASSFASTPQSASSVSGAENAASVMSPSPQASGSLSAGGTGGASMSSTPTVTSSLVGAETASSSLTSSPVVSSAVSGGELASTVL